MNAIDPLLHQVIMLPLEFTKTAKSIIDYHAKIKSDVVISKAKAELQNAEFKHQCEIRESRLAA